LKISFEIKFHWKIWSPLAIEEYNMIISDEVLWSNVHAYIYFECTRVGYSTLVIEGMHR
jgi:hypothetical protein